MTLKSYGYKEEGRGRGASAICCILPLLDYLVWAGGFFRTIMAAMIYSDDRDIHDNYHDTEQ